MSERIDRSVNISDHKLDVNLHFQIIPDNLVIFNEIVTLGEDENPAFIPKENELEFTFPESSGTSRLIYKDLSSFD
jgi:hypothetical protein